ncbi:protein-export membrane protein SecD [Candidatus Vecturithrix granuli]|uniref:Protein translocase subunit SecD n=1 Tax=Vecturithrix granuli TaxID=1499967 RepID=A0A081BYS1_VECG1|nr:protein-export membrane protein SecD [Candidatus Vecturithrix granuli]
MDKRLKWKAALAVALIVIVGVYLVFRLSAINLGLDLQGGLHLVLEVQADKVIETELVRAKDALSQELKKARIKFDAMNVDTNNALTITASTPEDLTQIKDYVTKEFPNLENKDLVSTGKSVTFGLQEDVVTHWKDNAIRQALITIRNRVDEFGLTEPVIQRQGKNRIIVELAGERDPQRAIDLIGRTAELRFQLVKDFAATEDDLLKRYDGNVPAGYEILPGAPEATSSGSFGAYLVETEAKVTGADLKDARVSKDEMNAPAVSFEFDRNGAKRFGTLTEQNIDKALAIVLDGMVQSAPVIRSRITDRGQITGSFTAEEANDLAIVLRAGALPAPVKILENISVGPTLGEDSITAGKRAIVIGGLLVVIFMAFYYKMSGIVADISLLFNFLFIMGTLAYFGATLTLPGLAGMALTIGMAVDANVLIYERVKEELRRGKTHRSAFEAGFSRANLTILDANLTTLIAAIVLFQFGTGAIKGFAVTLSIGILSTLFTALVLSKIIFDVLFQSGKVKQISI